MRSPINPIRVVLADDHSLVRAGVGSLLQNLPDVEVIAEATDGVEVLELIAGLKPDVAVLDISMPKMSGLEVAARVAEEFPLTRVIILSMYVDEEYIRKAIRAGAAGYLLKDSGVSELELALRAAVRGETYLSPAVSSRLVADYQKMDRGELTQHDPLTPRQREVLRKIAEGMTTKAIARSLDISVKTVETHRTQLMDRLDIHMIADLVRYAIRMGITKSD